jgi:DNA polymerase/3'-5' exonuclease PolX
MKSMSALPRLPRISEKTIDDTKSFPLLDLRSLVSNENNYPNEDLVNMITELIGQTELLKTKTTDKKDKANHTRRIGSFIRGRDAIKNCPFRLETKEQAKKLYGVGEGIAKRIEEYRKTGNLAELDKDVDSETRSIVELCTITGVGEVAAHRLFKNGYHSVEQLIRAYKTNEIQIGKHNLTHHQAVGLDYYYDLQQRMPWSEAHDIATSVKKSLKDLSVQVEICGSYRRHTQTCGDIDVLVSSRNEITMEDILRPLHQSGLLVANLTDKGSTKYMGVCIVEKIARRIDIRLVPYDSLGAAIIYFTGSGKFNKIMRHEANKRGYTLNEYGLFEYVNGVKGKKIPATDEKSIFNILNFVYLEPQERNF